MNHLIHSGLLPVRGWLVIGAILAGCSSPAPMPSATGGALPPVVNAVIEAVAANDVDALRGLLHFSSLPCTTQEGLGGPPKCLDGEPAGASVEVLPILGPEGHFLRRTEATSWEGIGPSALYGVSRIDASTYSDEFYPAGEFGVIFTRTVDGDAVVFQVVDAGIVRLDYILGSPTEDVYDGDDDVEFILGPFPRTE